MASNSPFAFAQQVRQEAAKVTWPTRKETLVTTAMVFVMVALCSVFFMVVEFFLNSAARFLLGLLG